MMVLCLRWSCCCTCIVSDCIMGIRKPLVVFLEEQGLGPMLWTLFSSHLFLFFNTWSISFHSFLVFHLLSLVLSIISLACAMNPFHVLFMHITCCQSSLHTFSILFVRFLCTLDVFNHHCTRSMCALCTLSVFDPCCMHFMCAKWCWSLLHTFCMHLMLSILVARILCALGGVNACCTFYMCV
jgi:hypothetical protein